MPQSSPVIPPVRDEVDVIAAILIQYSIVPELLPAIPPTFVSAFIVPSNVQLLIAP